MSGSKRPAGSLPPSKPPAGPAPPRRPVCAPAAMSYHCIADQLRKGGTTMSSPGWLHDLRFALAPRRGRRHHKRRDRLRAATPRLSLEVLEGRVTPSFGPATSLPVGPNPQVVVTADFNNDGHLDLATAN